MRNHLVQLPIHVKHLCLFGLILFSNNTTLTVSLRFPSASKCTSSKDVLACLSDTQIYKKKFHVPPLKLPWNRTFLLTVFHLFLCQRWRLGCISTERQRSTCGSRCAQVHMMLRGRAKKKEKKKKEGSIAPHLPAYERRKWQLTPISHPSAVWRVPVSPRAAHSDARGSLLF